MSLWFLFPIAERTTILSFRTKLGLSNNVVSQARVSVRTFGMHFLALSASYERRRASHVRASAREEEEEKRNKTRKTRNRRGWMEKDTEGGIKDTARTGFNNAK